MRRNVHVRSSSFGDWRCDTGTHRYNGSTDRFSYRRRDSVADAREPAVPGGPPRPPRHPRGGRRSRVRRRVRGGSSPEGWNSRDRKVRLDEFGLEDQRSSRVNSRGPRSSPNPCLPSSARTHRSLSRSIGIRNGAGIDLEGFLDLGEHEDGSHGRYRRAEHERDGKAVGDERARSERAEGDAEAECHR